MNTNEIFRNLRPDIFQSLFRWAQLEVETSASIPDELQAYLAGWLEGSLTRELISMHLTNTYEGYCKTPLSAFCQDLQKYLDDNSKWVKEQIEANAEDPYWQQVNQRC